MKSFKTWMEDQEDFVKDQDGKSRVFYHGTNANFSKFNPAFTSGQLGFHFGDEDQANSIYGDEKPNHLFKVNLRVKNPLRLDDQGAWQGQTVVDMVNKAIGTKLFPSASSRQIANAIKLAGYDGVIYKNEFEGDKDKDSYIVFTPEQINILEKITKLKEV